MPKLYEYLGITVFFFAGEHLPVHVHARYCPLSGKARKHFLELVNAKAHEILKKWSDVFVLNKVVHLEIITRRVK